MTIVGVVRGLLLPVAFGIGLASGAAAQELPCTWDRCALRFEEPWLVAGASGERVGRLGVFSVPPLAERVRGVDSAEAYALRFVQRQSTGTILSILGGAMVIGSYVWLYSEGSWSDGGSATTGPLVLLLGGAGVGLVGSLKLRSARHDMARAIWWYNRELPR
jgi:hypothetical protein